MRELVDPRPTYLELISITDSHVILDPPIVFLFGGEIAKSTEKPASVRDRLYRHLLDHHYHLKNSLVIPEDFKDWLHDAAYPDLLTFESDLAQTSSLVMIILESPGAIAELGAFSMSPALKSKVQIVLRTHYHEQKSFICLGPLRQLNNDYIWPYLRLTPIFGPPA